MKFLSQTRYLSLHRYIHVVLAPQSGLSVKYKQMRVLLMDLLYGFDIRALYLSIYRIFLYKRF